MVVVTNTRGPPIHIKYELESYYWKLFSYTFDVFHPKLTNRITGWTMNIIVWRAVIWNISSLLMKNTIKNQRLNFKWALTVAISQQLKKSTFGYFKRFVKHINP